MAQASAGNQAVTVKVRMQNAEFTEQYIPDSKQFSIQKISEKADEVLVLVYPFYQVLSGVKGQGEQMNVSSGSPKRTDDGLFSLSIIDAKIAAHSILTFMVNTGQDVVWYRWVDAADTVGISQRVKVDLRQNILKELIINKSLHYIKQLGMTAVETAKVLESRPGLLIYSTTTDMRNGDCFMALIPHQPLSPDSIKARTLLYGREGIEIKIYTDDIHLNWKKVDIGTGAFFIANVQHKQQFGADLSFEVYARDRLSIPDATLVVVSKNALPDARRGHDAKGLYQAEQWHQYIRQLQAEFKEQQLAEQLKRKAELSTILAGRTFKLAIAQNGKLQEISSQPGSVIYQINERFYLVMNPSLEYALLDMDNLTAGLQFHFSKAEYFPSIQLLALTGRGSHAGAVLQVETGKLTPGHYKQFVVRNKHLYANTGNETRVFSEAGETSQIALSEKVLFESPAGRYFLAKNQGRGEVLANDKTTITSHQLYFTQFGTVDDQGIILGRANQAIAKVLNDPSLVHTLHFYRFRNGQPMLVSKAGCSEAQYLGGHQVACRTGEYNWQLYTINGARQSSQQFKDLESLLASLKMNQADMAWNRELRPATLRPASIDMPERSELSAFSGSAIDVLGVIGAGDKRVWLIQ